MKKFDLFEGVPESAREDLRSYVPEFDHDSKYTPKALGFTDEVESAVDKILANCMRAWDKGVSKHDILVAIATSDMSKYAKVVVAFIFGVQEVVQSNPLFALAKLLGLGGGGQ